MMYNKHVQTILTNYTVQYLESRFCQKELGLFQYCHYWMHSTSLAYPSMSEINTKKTFNNERSQL